MVAGGQEAGHAHHDPLGGIHEGRGYGSPGGWWSG